MLDPQQVIVYRSRFEQQNDQFWYDHPEIALWFFGIFAAIFAVFWVGNALFIWRTRRRIMQNKRW